MSDRPIRLAVVGLKQGLEDVYIALHDAGYELVAVCDREYEPYQWITGEVRFEDSEQEYARYPHLVPMMRAIREHPDAGSVRFFDDYERMLSERDVEAVAIMVPDALHAPFSLAALEAGKWVLCTKPMADSIPAAWEIVRAAEANENRYLMSLPFAFGPMARITLELIANGEIGKPRLVRLDHFRGQFRPVFRRKEVTHGPVVAEGCHYVHMISLFAGAFDGKDPRFDRVAGFAGLDVHVDTQDIDDNGQVMIEFDNGVRVSHAYSYFSRVPAPQPLMILGEEGLLAGGQKRVTVYPHGCEPRSVDLEGDRDFPHSHHVGYASMYKHWQRVIREGEPPMTHARAAFENLITVHAAQRAVDEGVVICREPWLAEHEASDR